MLSKVLSQLEENINQICCLVKNMNYFQGLNRQRGKGTRFTIVKVSKHL